MICSMLRSISAVGLLLLAGIASAASDGPIYHVDVDMDDKASLQRGARLFVNYCMGCHSAKFMRYNRMAEDLGIPESVLKDNLMFGTDKVGETMQTAMPAEQAEEWFGVTPPDLTLTARSRGADWIYSYLMTFYRDPDSSTGFNNLQFPDVSMPHVLAELQGIKAPVYEDGDDKHITGLETVVEGSMSDDEYARAMRDLVNFMVYISEPAQLQRYQIGFWVIFYLLILLAVVYALKRNFWRDIH